MALYYLETSALVKLYIREQGTERLLQLVSRRYGHRFAVLSLSMVEFHSAVRRREREGEIDHALAQKLLDRFGEHLETKFLKQGVNDSVLDMAADLVDRYPLRAYDAVQLAGCLMMKTGSGREGPTFVSADRQLIEAAVAEKLLSMDPTS